MNDRPADGTLRLFVALELPQAVRSGLESVSRQLRRLVPDTVCRWVRPEGIHLTLKFLGETAGARLPALREALDASVSAFGPITLTPGGVGHFGGRHGIRVVWIGLEGEIERAAGLAGQIDRALAELGFSREKRPFRPHLTLGRVRDRASRVEKERLAAGLDSFETPELPSFQAHDVVLMASKLLPGGARYDALHRTALS